MKICQTMNCYQCSRLVPLFMHLCIGFDHIVLDRLAVSLRASNETAIALSRIPQDDVM